MASTHPEAWGVLFARLKAVWADPVDATKLRTPIAWPGVSFPDEAAPETYIRAHIEDLEPLNVAYGLRRYPGVLRVWVLSPAGQGTGAGAELAEIIAAGFRGWTASGFHFRRPPHVRYAGEGGDPGSDQAERNAAYSWHLVSVPFERDTYH